MKRTCTAMALSAVLLAGCGGGGGGGGAAATNTSASVVAIDCARQMAYVPLPTLSSALHGQVAVINLAADPDTTDPRVTTIDLGHFGFPAAAAVSPSRRLVMVISGSVLDTGYLDLIDENSNKLTSDSPARFPTGSRPIATDGIVYNPVTNSALVSMTGTPLTCPGAVSTCTGMALFDLGSKSFGKLIQFNNPVDNFALDPTSGIALAPSDATDPVIGAIDSRQQTACTLDDASLAALDADADGAAVDPATGIWVIGNYESSQATIINLFGASFAASSGGCSLNETNAPNSLNYDTQTGSPMPGVAINPQTHEAVLTGPEDNQIALLKLPLASVAHVTDAPISSVNSTIPNTPDGDTFQAADFPYSDTIDTCNNRLYLLNDSATYLVEIDLATFAKDPGAIATPLPAGNCAGTTSSFACDNQNGVRFFPLPGA